jgi:DNA-binding IclR family transcriptional regulator
LAELAARLDLNPSTVYRYVATLEDAGLLVRNQRGGYRLGLRVIELAGIALNQIEVRKHALDEMDQLRDEVNLLTHLAVLPRNVHRSGGGRHGGMEGCQVRWVAGIQAD